MSIYDFCNMCMDPSMLNVEIWDSDLSEVVYQGPFDEMPIDFEDEIVESFDVPTRVDWITINIH